MHLSEFEKRAKDMNLTLKHDGDYSIKLSFKGKVVVTVIKPVQARIIRDFYHELPEDMKQEIHLITSKLDRKQFNEPVTISNADDEPTKDKLKGGILND